jgi:peptide/nickel transport system substrate-binding protein
MRLAMPFGATSSYDPQTPADAVGRLRNYNLFDGLFQFDDAGQLAPALAEEASSNADATEWTLRLRSGVTFHDGRPFTADDVVYSLKRILDPKTKAEAFAQLGMIDARGIRKIDKTTVKIPLHQPFVILPTQLGALGTVLMVPVGMSDFKHPIGTGPFMFVRGNSQKFVLKRNPHYWRPGLPRLDGVEVINIQDPTARLNAVLSGQVDAIDPVDPSQVAAAGANPKVTVFTNKTSTFMPLYMTVTKRPFTDNRVREAIKFAADRKQMNDLAYGGNGTLGNDMFGLTDPGYPKDIPQRPYDPERAKALWNQAGMAGTKLQFWTSDLWPGQLTHATAFAQQAKAAGIDVTVRRVPVDQFFTKAYGVQPFADDYWFATPALSLMSLAFVPKGAYYATASWASPRTTDLYRQAVAEQDDAKRADLTGEISRDFRDNGPYVIWAFEAGSNIYSAKIGGQENSAIRGLNGYRLDKFFVKS